MKAIGWSILAVVIGLVVGSLLVAGIEHVGHIVYLVPSDLDVNNREAMEAYVKSLPTGALLFVLFASSVGTLAGSFTAGWLAGRAEIVHGLVTGAFFLLATIANLWMIPYHPAWFGKISVILVIFMALVGSGVAKVSRGTKASQAL